MRQQRGKAMRPSRRSRVRAAAADLVARAAGDRGGGRRGGERRRRVIVGAAAEAAVAPSDPREAVAAGGNDGEFGSGEQRSGGDVRFHEEEERGGRTHVRSKGLGCQRRCRSVRVRRQTHGRSCFSQPLGVTPTVLYTIHVAKSTGIAVTRAHPAVPHSSQRTRRMCCS